MDLVQVHHPFISGRLVLLYCRPLYIPVALTNHTRYDLYAQATMPILPKEISASFLQSHMQPFWTAVNLVVSPSHGMADDLRKLGVTSAIEDCSTSLLAGHNRAAFIAKLSRLCFDRNLRRFMGHEARKVSEKYAIEHTSQVMLAHQGKLVSTTLPCHRGIGSRIRRLVERLCA